MLHSRRFFLGLAAAGAALLAAGAPAKARQGDASDPDDPGPFGRNGTPDSTPRPNPKDWLEANQKNVKKDVERLSELVQEMQKQVDQAGTKDVLPLDVLRETDEIEKLAKHIRTLVRG